MSNRAGAIGRLSLLLLLGLISSQTAWAGQDGEAALKTTMTFRVMVSSFSGGLLTQAGSGQMSVTVGGRTAGVYSITSGGRLSFSIPRGQTSNWTLSVPGFDDRHFRAQFGAAGLSLTNGDRNNRAVSFRGNGDGTYTLEYYQERLYVCNQGDRSGPILGKLKTGRRVGASSIAAAAEEGGGLMQAAPRRITVWASGDCLVYGGQRGWRSPGVPGPGWWGDYYLDLNRHPDHQLLGRANGTSLFAGGYAYYVLVSPTRFDLDAVQFSNGEYILINWLAFNVNPNFLPRIEGPPDGVSCTVGLYNYNLPSTYRAYVALDARETVNAQPAAGGPEDDFGGPLPGEVVAGVVTDVRDLPSTEQVSAEWNQARRAGQSLSDNRVAGFSLGSGTATTGLIDPQTVQMPGLVFQWVYAGTRATQQWLLPLGRSGTLPGGITWRTLTGTLRSGSRALVFLRQFAASYLAGLARGRHTLNYWLQDSTGRRSNVRTETITIQ